MIDWDALVLKPCAVVFGEPAVYIPVDGDSYDIAVVFDEANKDLNLSDVGVNTTTPIVGIRQAELRGEARKGDRIWIQRTGKTYAVKDPDPDGHGNVKLKLNWKKDP